MDIKTTLCENAQSSIDYGLTAGFYQDHDECRVESRVQKAVY